MKQTEIDGVADTLIPDDWEVKKLGELFEMRAGGDVNKQHFSYYKSDKYKYKIFSNGLENEGVYGFTDLPRYKGDSITITGRGTVGVSMYRKDDFDAVIRLLVLESRNKNQTNNFFISELINEVVKFPNESTGVPQLTVPQIKDVLIPLPPLPEQQRIAKALSDVDALISTTEKLIQKKKNIKQGAMQNLLTGKKRLPGFAKSTNYKQSELGLIPEDWEVKSLGEIFEFRPNNTFTRDCLNDSKGEYQNVHYGDVLIKYPSILDCSKESIPFINEGINVKFSKYGIMEGDIIIADTAEDETVGKVVEIFNLGEKKIVSGLHTFLCRKITDDFTPRWLGYFMNQSIFHNQLLPFITGTKVSAISRTAIQNVKVLIPSKEEQTAIANVLSSMDKEIETLNTKLEKYINLKTAMMQQLLMGKIRLK